VESKVGVEQVLIDERSIEPPLAFPHERHELAEGGECGSRA
jgi:hypothetical protein